MMFTELVATQVFFFFGRAAMFCNVVLSLSVVLNESAL